MKTLEFTKYDGKISDMAAIHDWIDRSVKWLRNGRHELVLREKAQKRSVAQNRLMWMWFACIEKEVGQSQQDVHDYYCYKFLPRDIADPSTGQAVRVGGHTSTLTTEAFTDFLNKVQADAATELGIMLPTPDDIYWSEFEDEFKQYVR